MALRDLGRLERNFTVFPVGADSLSQKGAEQRLIQSMTGYAVATRETAAGQLSVEVRSVNSRFLDLAFRLPDEQRACEPILRERITARVLRGKVECRVAMRRATGSEANTLDEAALARLAAMLGLVNERFPQLRAPTTAEILRWPGVMSEGGDAPDLLEDIATAAGQALEEFVAARAREGEKLVAFVRERIDEIDELVAEVAEAGPALLVAHETRLTERLRAALGEVTVGTGVALEETMARVRQEVAAYGLRVDIAEEIGRLRSHVAEFRRILGGPGPVGKRLEFLVQELNREANTLGSKAAAIDLTGAAVEMKVRIEQIREQLQNLE